MRDFRDKILYGGQMGLSFVKFYYLVSPTLANFIERRDALRSILRRMLGTITHICAIILKGKSRYQLS
ncbi:MAG: CFI-box-CTERM domain-containing protein [Candidatus Hadarchaeaceae archaeon]